MAHQRPRKPSSGSSERRPSSTVRDLLEELRPVAVGVNGYTETDRARDFIGLFSTDQGRRVLSQISQEASAPILPHEASDLGQMAFKAGKRWLELFILKCMRDPTPVVVENKPSEE